MPLRCPPSCPSFSCAKQSYRTAQSSRSFSSTPSKDQRVTRARRQLFRWLTTQGENFRNPLVGSTNYLGAYNALGQLKRVVEATAASDRNKKKGNEFGEARQSATGSKDELPPETTRDRVVFPLNKAFVSQPVLGDRLREEIWSRIMKDGKSVREVSAELGVEMSRVGAVVRLKEIEKEWQRIGKPRAGPYARAIMSMLPKTEFDPKERITPHESINDLPVHAATGQQIFHPTSESRHFTRVDAAKVFHEKLLPADDRVPHPELAEMHRELKVLGLTREERQVKNKEREAAVEKKRQAAAARQARKESSVKRVDTGRWEYRFSEANVDDAGKDGRGHKGTGWRYGQPLMDRSRGTVRIPTSVE